MKKAYCSILILLLVAYILCTCLAFSANLNQIKIINIKYIFYTVGIKTNPLVPVELIQGEELKQGADPRILAEYQPNVFDLALIIENPSKFTSNPPKLLVEFWISEALIINDEEGAMDIDKMRTKAKWSKLWERSINLNQLKPKENRELVIERVKIDEIEKNVPRDLALMGWNCKVICNKLKFEKPFEVNYLY